jgi:hypothetical protein
MNIRSSRIVQWIGLLIIGAVCTSCSTLKSPHFVGAKEPFGEKDLASETVWTQGDDVYFLKRLDSNTLVAATMEWDAKKNDFAVRSFPIIVTKLGDHLFLNVKEDDLYSIFRVATACDDEPSLLLFTIDPDKLRKDVAEGKIQAREEGDDIILECTKEEQDAYILENINTVFHMDGASIVRQISKQKE